MRRTPSPGVVAAVVTGEEDFVAVGCGLAVLLLLLFLEPLPSVELHAVRTRAARTTAAGNEIKRRIKLPPEKDCPTIPS
jgi:hypothetical protein